MNPWPLRGASVNWLRSTVFTVSFFKNIATAKKFKLDHFLTSKMHFVESAVSLVIYGVYADFGSELLRVSKLPL